METICPQITTFSPQSVIINKIRDLVHMLDIIKTNQDRDGIYKMAWHRTRLVQWIMHPATNVIQFIHCGEGGMKNEFIAEIIPFPKLPKSRRMPELSMRKVA